MPRKKKKDEFLNSFLGGAPRTIDDLQRHSIKNDKWDQEDFKHLMEEMREFAVAEDKLSDKVDTGASAYADAFFSLVKAVPELEDPNEMKPTHKVNHAVLGEMLNLKEYEEMRSYSTGDEIAAALATIAMEPELETLFDKLEQEQKLADQLADQMQQMQGLQQEDRDLDDMMDQMMNGQGDGDGNGQGQSQNFQDQKSKIEEAMKKLQEQIDDTSQQLQEALDKASPGIKSAMRDALKTALKDVSDMEQAAITWGLDPGTLHRLPPEERIEMARRLNNDRFKKIAQLFGPMHRMAFAEQQRKTVHSNDEIYDVEIGNDLGRLLAAELVNIRHPILKRDFYRRFYEGQLLQYKMRGEEKLAKGGIICCIDGSGSMAGDNEIWSKAVGLTLLQIAKSQKREFYAMEFGGPRALVEFDFRDPKNITPENVISFAECFLNGGPLRIDQRVVTPNGWQEIGQLQTGDQVFGPDGKPATVLGVFPQGVLDLYKMTLSDGTEIICDGTHRFTVFNNKGSKFTHTVNELLRRGIVKDYSGRYPKMPNYRQFQWRLPTTEALELPVADLPIDPYLMGYLLGDGSFSGSKVCVTAEGDDLPWVDVLPEGVTYSNYEKREGFCPSYGLKGPKWHDNSNPVREALRDTGLLGLHDEDKFIPGSYLWASKTQRWALLQGLLDSDGNYAGAGRAEFTNISKKLIDGVIDLVHSLGGGAHLRDHVHVRDNERERWTVQIMLNQQDAPFRLERKVQQWKPRKYRWTQMIESIERVDSAEAICIKVDREDGLFLTEGMAVTHNTDFMTPLSRSLDLLREEHDRRGAVKADIVFVTDGACGVHDDWLKQFKEEQERLSFRVYGVAIGCPVESEPLATICDKRVLTVKQLTSGDDLREVFRAV